MSELRHCDQCNAEFMGKGRQRFCSSKCRERAKRIRAGVNVLTEIKCDSCGVQFLPIRGNQKYCSDDCRLGVYAEEKQERRNKVCVKCSAEFVDESLKNTCVYCHDCIQKDVKDQDLVPTSNLRRDWNVKTGRNGRLDDITTMRKYTETWWGRVAELIYAGMRPDALDANAEYGAKAPYDFDDPAYGKVQVRSARVRQTPFEKECWSFLTHGKFDTFFAVGFREGSVAYVWRIPKEEVNRTGLLCTPTSSEYRYKKYELPILPLANRILRDCEDYEYSPVEDPYAWMDDINELNLEFTAHKGRKGELLYKRMYPKARDMNRLFGSGQPYDFYHADLKLRVDVKTTSPKPNRKKRKWSFGLGKHPRNFDLFSLLCLDEAKERVVYELRIPVEVLKDRELLHIFESSMYKNWGDYLQ